MLALLVFLSFRKSVGRIPKLDNVNMVYLKPIARIFEQHFRNA
jgi:hypothetical protein